MAFNVNIPRDSHHARFLTLFILCLFATLFRAPGAAGQSTTIADDQTTSTTSQMDSNNSSSFNISSVLLEFYPASPLKIVEDATVNLTVVCYNPTDVDIIAVLSYNWSAADTSISVASGVEGMNMTVQAKSNASMTLKVYGVTPGIGKLLVTYILASNLSAILATVDANYQIWGIRLVTTLQTVCQWGVIGSCTISMASFASQLKSSTVKQYFTTPGIICVHLFSQMIALPLLSWGIGVAFDLPSPMAFSLLVIGCASSGAPSTSITVLFRGDVAISTFMTLFSVCLNTISLPFWMFTLGAVVKFDGGKLGPFPWLLVFILSCVFVLPSWICYAVNYHSPKSGRILSLILRPISMLASLTFLGLDYYANVWVYPLITSWISVSCSAAFIFCGSAVGLLLAALFRNPVKILIAMCIEIPTQNIAFSILLFQTMLPIQDTPIAYVIPVMYIPVSLILPVCIFFPLSLVIAAVRRRLPRVYEMDVPMETRGSGPVVYQIEINGEWTPESDVDGSSVNDDQVSVTSICQKEPDGASLGYCSNTPGPGSTSNVYFQDGRPDSSGASLCGDEVTNDVIASEDNTENSSELRL